jgi:hypothetical protein
MSMVYYSKTTLTNQNQKTWLLEVLTDQIFQKSLVFEQFFHKKYLSCPKFELFKTKSQTLLLFSDWMNETAEQ